MVAEVVLAELAGVVPQVEQELGERRSTRTKVAWAAGKLRWNHAGAQRMHAGEEGVAPGRTALLGVVMHEDGTFLGDAVDVRRFADHQPTVVDARLHPANVVTHDEQDIGLARGRRRCRGSGWCRAEQRCCQGQCHGPQTVSHLHLPDMIRDATREGEAS
ncbi:MAG: hypothetical protein AW07_03538 [Candidatus Accumulibacter sp. SK-11]|nr:MAG: hypothetical protein AW07_03538 [Candidatus Accumulibacter sp. SK-11]